MKINIEILKRIQGWLETLSEYCIDLSESDGYLDEEEYDELPDEIEIEDIPLEFPDDQEVTVVPTEEFISYMSEIENIRRVGECIVRTDHVIQTVINSSRLGYNGFDDRLYSMIFKGENFDAAVIESPFLVGVMNAKEGRYDEDLGIGSCYSYTAIEITTKEVMDDPAILELVEKICFYLTDSLGVAVFPWSGHDISEIYDRMNEYYDDDDDNEESEDGDVIVNDDELPGYTPLLKMYRQAAGVDDPEIQFLQYYKIIEYVSPVVARFVAYEQLNKKLDLLPAIKRDYKFLESIIAIVQKYDKDMRDNALAASVIENCVDVLPLYEMLPDRLRKMVKGNVKLQKDSLTCTDVSDEQMRGIKGNIAAILYATRNCIVHAKSNYEVTGSEMTIEELPTGNEIMKIIARSIINWNQRQAEGFRV